MELTEQWKALLGAALGALQGRGAHREPCSTGRRPRRGPFERTDNMWSSGRAGLIWQPTDHAVVLRLGRQLVQPVGRAGRVRRRTAPTCSPTNQDLDPEENRNYEVGAHLGLRRRPAAARGALPQREDQRAHASTDDRRHGARRQAARGRHRVRSSPGYITAELGDLQRRRVHGRQDRLGQRPTRATTPLGVADVAGNVWTVYKLGGGWEVGGGVRGTSGFSLTDANNGEVPGYAVVRLHRGLRAGATTRSG